MKKTIPLDNFLVNIFRFSSTLSDTERHCFWERFEGKTYKEIGKTCPRFFGGIGINPGQARQNDFKTQALARKYLRYHYLHEGEYDHINVNIFSKGKRYQALRMKQKEIFKLAAPKIEKLKWKIIHHKEELKKYYHEIRKLREASKLKGLYK